MLLLYFIKQSGLSFIYLQTDIQLAYKWYHDHENKFTRKNTITVLYMLIYYMF